jgi:hypothetical protein
MASTLTPTKIENDGSPSRLPLLPRTISPNSVKTRKVRRKDSFILLSDSTDDHFSPHGSIYDAQYVSASEENIEKLDGIVASMPESPSSLRVIDENVKIGDTRIPSITIPDTQFLYGNGTMLDTITEQRSSLTMRSLARPKSLDQLGQMKSLTHSDSFELSKVPRRMQSLSLDDLALIKLSYHGACNRIESKRRSLAASESKYYSPGSSIHEIYTQPRVPIHAPIVRPSTPPGMPSWTAGQALGHAPHTADRQGNAIQRFFGLAGSTSIPSSSNPPLPYGPTGRPPPRFRPPRSSYAQISQHPFTRAPIARSSDQETPTGKRKMMQRVRFTPSATARDSEQNNIRNEILAASNSAGNRNESMQVVPRAQSQRRCPHRSGRRATMKSLNRGLYNPFSRRGSRERGEMELPYSNIRHNTPATPSNNLGSSLQAGSIASARPSSEINPVVADGIAGNALLNSSTDHLMTGANPESQPKAAWCWKCSIDKVVMKLDKFWYNGAACLCFVCCGFDIDEDSNRERGRACGIPPAGFRYLDGSGGYEDQETYLAPRRVVVDRTFGVAL